MSRSKWSPRAWTLLAAFALLVMLSFASSSSFAAPPAAGPPTTGKAIPPDGPPKTPPKPADDRAEPADASEAPGEASGEASEASGEENLFQATETPDGVDSSRRESEIYGARIDGLQGDVDDLKERIFRSKARLSLLKETVLHGVLAGSRVIILHRNLMGSQFRLTKLVVILDGAQIYARTDDSGALDQEDELTVLDGNIVPGPHTITVELTYQGQGFGVFSYLNGYTFESRSSNNFTAPENGSLRLMSSGYEKGNLTTEMKDRPSVDWQEIPLDASGKPLPQARRKSSKRAKNKTKRNKRQQKPASKRVRETAEPKTPAARKPAPQKPRPQKPGQKPAAKDGE